MVQYRNAEGQHYNVHSTADDLRSIFIRDSFPFSHLEKFLGRLTTLWERGEHWFGSEKFLRWWVNFSSLLSLISRLAWLRAGQHFHFHLSAFLQSVIDCLGLALRRLLRPVQNARHQGSKSHQQSHLPLNPASHWWCGLSSHTVPDILLSLEASGREIKASPRYWSTIRVQAGAGCRSNWSLHWKKNKTHVNKHFCALKTQIYQCVATHQVETWLLQQMSYFKGRFTLLGSQLSRCIVGAEVHHRSHF